MAGIRTGGEYQYGRGHCTIRRDERALEEFKEKRVADENRPLADGDWQLDFVFDRGRAFSAHRGYSEDDRR